MGLAKFNEILPGQFEPGIAFFYLGQRVLFDFFGGSFEEAADFGLAPSQHFDDFALREFMQMDQPQKHPNLGWALYKRSFQAISQEGNEGIVAGV